MPFLAIHSSRSFFVSGHAQHIFFFGTAAGAGTPLATGGKAVEEAVDEADVLMMPRLETEIFGKCKKCRGWTRFEK